jgi:hypothetical protein
MSEKIVKLSLANRNNEEVYIALYEDYEAPGNTIEHDSVAICTIKQAELIIKQLEEFIKIKRGNDESTKFKEDNRTD